ncbi:hypothetical protein [Nocardiopsis ansamitocini]|uniref:Uncharacterized protein n=1 Tax=Nocardiopsis ansamitocini TaxID=1670832 RepID=A0A9W6P975_9ACTN|nr:hypothetical protein [Nocardiopsis ansamitocini]GLU49485.1 hypothetical protein Nans01_38360 [Nocardiopsis ansamitocini]
MKRLYAGLARMVGEPTAAGHLRRQVFFFVPIPVLLGGVLALALDTQWSAPGWTILFSGSISVTCLLIAFLVHPTPLPEGLSQEASVRRSLHRFRQITGLRITLAMLPILLGAGAALAGGGMFPYAVAMALAWPQLLLALPGYFTVSRARRAMEAWGTKAYLWAALAQPAKVEWPLITRYLARRKAKAASAAVRGPSRPAPRPAPAPAVQEQAAPSAQVTPEPEPQAPAHRPEPLIPGLLATGGSAVVPRPSGQLLRLRANTRPKQRSSRSESRQRTKN